MKNATGFFFLVLCLVCHAPLYADTTDVREPRQGDFWLGVIGGAAQYTSATNLSIVRGASDCGVFSEGTKIGLMAGITADYIVLPRFLNLSARLFYSIRPAFLEARTADYEVFDPASASYQLFRQRHTFDAELTYLMLDVGLTVRPIPVVPVYVRLAVDAGNPVFGNTYEREDEIEAPNSALYPNRRKTRQIESGAVPGVGTSTSLLGGLGAELSLSDRLILSPELSWRQGIGSISSIDDWKISGLQGTLGLRFRLNADDEPEPAPDTTPPPPPPPPPPVVAEAPKPRVYIEKADAWPMEFMQTVVTQTFPLLPYVFFDSASANLRSVYFPPVDKNNLIESNLEKSSLQTYYHALHLIGSRMRRVPDAKIRLTGSSDGKELRSPAERRALGLARAEAVRSFLEKEWSIDRKRIEVGGIDFPTLASNPEYPEGDVENRRVELESKELELLGPVVHERFMEYKPQDTTIRLKVALLEPDSVASWSVTLSKLGRPVYTTESNGIPPRDLIVEVPGEKVVEAGRDLAPTDSLPLVLVVRYKSGEQHASSANVPIKRTNNVYELSRLSLIVFDFNKSSLTDQNQALLQRFLGKPVPAGTTATIVGSTDRLGERNYNQKLSEERAQTVQANVGRVQPAIRVTDVRGIGPSRLPYNNDLPEGRYYCRTVSVEVYTPVLNPPGNR